MWDPCLGDSAEGQATIQFVDESSCNQNNDLSVSVQRGIVMSGFRRLAYLLFITLFLLPTLTFAQLFWETGSLIWRDANLLNRGDFLLMMHGDGLFASEGTDEGSENEWMTNDLRFNLTAGTLLLDRLEIIVNVPIHAYEYHVDYYSGDNFMFSSTMNSSGLGDMIGMARFGMITTENSAQHLLTLSVGVRLPTGATYDETRDKDIDLPLGDGSYDYGFGFVHAYQANSKWALHTRMQYWFNGTWTWELNPPNGIGATVGNLISDLEYDYGNTFFGSFAIEYRIDDRFDLRAGISHTNELETTVSEWFPTDRTHRYDFDLEAILNPGDSLLFRPKLSLPFDDGGNRWAPKFIAILQVEYVI
jgi:Putative MetA-pathway of phenol degradation